MKTTNSKLFAVTIIILLLTNSSLFSQETEIEEVTVAKNQIIGATFGIQFHEIDNSVLNFKRNGYYGDIFYRHFMSSDSTFYFLPIRSKSYWTANLGYTHYENENVKRDDIPITLGSYFYFGREAEFYFGAEFGALYRNEKQTFSESTLDTSFSETKFLMVIGFGAVFPLSESLSLDISYKDIYVYKDAKNHRVSAGFSYSF